MGKRESISSSVIRRLPRYYRYLNELEKQGVTHISSKELAEKMNATASQVRQDFNCFGEFGRQGIGYSVAELREQIEDILGINCHYPTILIGAGNIGTAIANQVILENRCFKIIAVFDKDKNKTGKKIQDLTILSTDKLESFCKEHEVVTAIICVPKTAAEEIFESLYKVGVRSFWNFSHNDLNTKHSDVIVENVHLSDSLMQLCFRINQDNTQS